MNNAAPSFERPPIGISNMAAGALSWCVLFDGDACSMLLDCEECAFIVIFILCCLFTVEDDDGRCSSARNAERLAYDIDLIVH